jgi:phosphohistidine swiveling domain-containing protein
MHQEADPARSSGEGVAAVPGDPAAPHLQIIESHLVVHLGDPGAVEAAYGGLGVATAADLERATAARIWLAGLLRNSTNRTAPTLFRLLAADADADPAPAPLLIALLHARAPALRAQAVTLVSRAVASGRVLPDLDLAVAVATAVGRDGLHAALDDATLVLTAVQDARLPLARGDPLGRLLEPSVPNAVRLLAARLLDRDEHPAPAGRIARVLGALAASRLAHYLAYTRATHGDLVALAPGPAPVVPALPSLLAAEAVLGQGRLAATLARLGWARVSGGITAEPIAVLSLADSFPFILRPAEARVAERSVPTRGRWDGWVVTARGAEERALETGEDGSAATIARFRRYSLDHAELLGEILEVAPVTGLRARRILALLDRVVSDYVALFSGMDAEAGDVPDRYASLRESADRALAAADGPDALLPPDVAYLIQAFEDPQSTADIRTLHGLKRFLHQRGLRHAFQLFGSAGAANQTVDLVLVRDGQPSVVLQQVRYIDFEGQEAPELPLAVRLVVEAYRTHLIHGITALPRIRVLVYGTEVQLYVWFRNHPAFLRLDLSPPRRGGMIDLEYFAVSQYDLGQHPAVAVPAVQRTLRRLGFHVEMDGTRLHARYDKERALDLSEIVTTAAMLLRLMPRLMDLDWAIADLDLRPDQRDAAIDDQADFLSRFGLTPSDPTWLPGTPSTDVVRPIRTELRRRGLRPPPLAGGRPPQGAGQLDLEKALLDPLRSAIARGEVVEHDGDLGPAPPGRYRREHEALRLARALVRGGGALRRATRTAVIVRPLDRWLRFQTTGTIHGFRVERATLSCRDGPVTLCVLRDGRGVARIAVATRGLVPFRVRTGRRGPWERPGELTPPELVRLLVRDNYRSPGTEGQPASVDRPADLVAVFSKPDPRPATPPLPGDRVMTGLPAAPGRAAGFVRIASGHRPPEDFDGAVLVARTIEPADAPCLARAAAAVSTGGGSLSHVGLLALELGKASLIVDGEWHSSADGEEVLVLRRTELRHRVRQMLSLPISCWEPVREHVEEVREGDLVVVDAQEGRLRILGADRDALFLHQGLRDLETATRAVADARTGEALLAARGALLRITHQLHRAVARMDRPVLVHYAVRELIAAQSSPGAGAGTRDRHRLLEALCGHPRHGDAARTARTAAVETLALRLRGLTATAREAIPRLESPLEVVLVRLIAARLREGLLGIAGMYSPGDPAARTIRHVARAAAGVDLLAASRLAELRTTLLQELRSATRPGADDGRLLYVLEAIHWIDEVLPPRDPPRVTVALERAQAATTKRANERRKSLETRLVIGAQETGPGLERYIGRKASVLGEVTRLLAGAAVPPWFAITHRAFRAALATPTADQGHHGPATLEAAIAAILERPDLEPAHKSARIRELWLGTPLPDGLGAAIQKAYDALGMGDPSPLVAIRSSAVEEDAPSGTWAGQFDTFLFVSGPEALRRHLQLAWAGLWSTRALYHRHAGEAPAAMAGGGVLVQRMVNARVAGVATSVDAVRGDMGELVINAGLGLGEGIVSGTVAADEVHVVRPEPGGGPLRLRYRVADKRERVVLDDSLGSGTRRVETLFHQRLRPALEYTELETLVNTVVALDSAFGQPVDVEFALEGPRLWILQARPIPLFRAALAETTQRYPIKETRR